MKISREKKIIGDNIIITQVREEYSEHSFYYINSNITKKENFFSVLGKIKSWLDINNLTLLTGFVFGLDPGMECGPLHDILPLVFLSDNMVLTYDIQLTCTDKKDMETMATGEKCNIRSMNHYDSRLHYISGIQPNISGDGYAQTYNAFMTLKTCLEKNHIDYKGLARTWLYLDNILDWYDKFNLARSDFFNKEGIYNKLIPASTGIGLGNHCVSCLSLSAFAVSEKGRDKVVRVIESPMQCPAQDYKSSFSRAVEIDMQKSKKLMISGTASIDSEGCTVYPDSIIKQVDHTMKVVKAILEKGGYLWENTVRGIAYFPEPENARYFIDYCSKNNIDSSYFLLTAGTVCRKDLVFELELDAVKNVRSE
ncbi:MAG: hypothetical protein ACLFN1_05385 [Bacteroidales bacterium]